MLGLSVVMNPINVSYQMYQACDAMNRAYNLTYNPWLVEVR